LAINQLIDEADRCVKCALCLPCCPTYQLSQNEAVSPRGRIALMQAWLQGGLADSRLFNQHLDSCLMCRSCEGACPSGVRYGALMDGVRARRWSSLGWWRRFKLRLLADLLSSRRSLSFIAPLVHRYQISSISSLLHNYLPSRLKRMEAMLPPPMVITEEWQLPCVDTLVKRRRVMLFTGCVSQLFEREVLQAAEVVLSHLGCDVVLPKKQGCCGAMHRHMGDCDSADNLMMQNRQDLSDVSFDALLTIASGCGAELAEQGGFAQPVREIGDYLAQLDWPDELKPLKARVLIHEPCSMFYGRFDLQAVPRLLERIPQLRQVTFGEDRLCCGAAGSYMFTQAENSQRLQSIKIDAVKRLRPDILVTSNTGCALQFRSGFREAGLDIEVLHPLQLLARQFKSTQS